MSHFRMSKPPACREHKKNIQSRIWGISGIRPSIRRSVTAGAGASASDAAYAIEWGLSGWPMRPASMDGLARSASSSPGCGASNADEHPWMCN
jgi:hypothetical protein